MHVAQRFDAAFRATAEHSVEARVQLVAWLRAWLASHERVLDDVALAVAEACTNAVVHAHRDGHGGPHEGRFRLVAELDGAVLLVTVSDDGGGIAPRCDSPGSGFGLPLMAALTDELSIAPGPDGRGTVVKLRFALGEAPVTPAVLATPGTGDPSGGPTAPRP